jgi:hypothetical protein
MGFTTRAAAIAIVLFVVQAFGQTPPERFWLAGRYDGNRVIVYFDAVKFNRTVPADAHKIVQPVVDGFFQPVELPASYIAQFLKKPGVEHFALGDQYDLLTGDGNPVTTVLTTLVGTEGDEETGNDSYIGALATVKDRDTGYLSDGYYAVRRHKQVAQTMDARVRLVADPQRFGLQIRIVGLLTQRMKEIVAPEEWAHLQNVSPRFSVQSFYLANRALRYYAKLDWSPHALGNDETNDILGAWLTATPALRVLTIEIRKPPGILYAQLPVLQNVVDLGGGRTGMIVDLPGADSTSLQLVEYRDGMSLKQMPHLYEISAGE